VGTRRQREADEDVRGVRRQGREEELDPSYPRRSPRVLPLESKRGRRRRSEAADAVLAGRPE
jgi:hypothetical protein